MDALGTSLAGHDAGTKGICWPSLPRNHTTLGNLSTPTCGLPEVAPSSGVPPPMQWTTDGPRSMPPAWQRCWESTRAQLSTQLKDIRKQQRASSIGSTAGSSNVLCLSLRPHGLRCGTGPPSLARPQNESPGEPIRTGCAARTWTSGTATPTPTIWSSVIAESMAASSNDHHPFLAFLDLWCPNLFGFGESIGRTRRGNL